MPLQASPFTSVPNGISQPAQQPDPAMAAIVAQMMARGAGGGGGLGGGMGSQFDAAPQGGDMLSPPSAQVPPPPGLAPGNMPGQGGPEDAMQGPDLFQKVAQYITDKPELWILLFAGMGMREALEKTGKFRSKPHRANEQLAAQGYDTGTSGQTGIPSSDQLAQKASGLGSMQGY